MSQFGRQFRELYKEISSDIFAFCCLLNFRPTWQQAMVLELVNRRCPRIAVKSGQGPGKTTVSAIVGLWRSLQDVDALTVITAPTMRQCKDVWLVEARRRLDAAHPMLNQFIKSTKTKIEIADRPDWGVRLVTATKEENAQGYHEKNMTVIGEEASGIPREIITQFKGTLSNPNSLLMLIGNPNSRDCAFFDCFNSQKHMWATLTFDAEDTARDYPQIVNPQRNADLAEEFGSDSDVYRVRVKGEFPRSDPRCVMASEDVEFAMQKDQLIRCSQIPRDPEHGGTIARQIGMDFARFGGDENTVFRRTGNAIVEWWAKAHVEPSEAVTRGFEMQRRAVWRDENVDYVPDAGGIGQGVLHLFYEAGKQVHEFHANGRAYDSQTYENKTTEAWFHLAKLVKEKKAALPRDQQLLQQLTTRQYFMTRKGKLVLESKDEYMKRGYNSPDRADGVVNTFYDQITLKGMTASQGKSSRELGSSVRA